MPPNILVQFVIFQNKKKLMTETKSITRFINHYTVRLNLSSYVSVIKLSHVVPISIRKVLRLVEPKFVYITDKTNGMQHF